MNVLVILGHPRTDSFCGALADAYEEGAEAAAVNVRRLDLAQLSFERDVTTVDPSEQEFEADVERCQRSIDWADHLAFVYPNWWGTMPALLKAFFDRVFTPGFAFESYEEGEGSGHRELLRGRTAELLVTMDVPPWVYRWIQREPGTNAIETATLGYAGVRTTRKTYAGPIEGSSPSERRRWLDRARELGRDLETGPDGRLGRARRRASAWLGALRLQFYPMAWVAYAVGALAAGGVDAGATAVTSTATFWLGFAFLCFLEAATVLTNERFDYETDRRNAFAGPFTGGSRVLVEDRLDPDSVRTAASVAGGLAAVSGLGAALASAGSTPVALACMLVLAVLALGYTVPPLSLSYRTLGELDVAATHSLAVVLLGYVLFGGSWSDPAPWLLGIPLLLATLPSITLAGVPDCRADRAAGKLTIAARFGVDAAGRVAQATALLAVAAVAAIAVVGPPPDAYGLPIYASVVHAAGLVWLVDRRLFPVEDPEQPRRIDLLMVASLSYVLWFGVGPLVGLL